MTGFIKSIQPSWYGFIIGEDGQEYFFHRSEYDGDWEKLQEMSPPRGIRGPVVQFIPVSHIKGVRATKVKFLVERI